MMRNMKILSNICHLAALISCIDALIIPDDLPGILNFIIDKIPRIKKGFNLQAVIFKHLVASQNGPSIHFDLLPGTDSRIGVGFRFGQHADFQVLLELGPQTNTQPLGPNADSKKRRQIQRPVAQSSYNTDTVADTPGGKWLSSWKSEFFNPKTTKYTATGVHQMIENPMIGKNDITLHLQQLYKKSQEPSGRSVTNGSENSEKQIIEVSNLTEAPVTDSSNSTSAEPVIELSS